MKSVVLLLAAGCVFWAGCGGKSTSATSSSTAATGAWQATLTSSGSASAGATATPAMTFTFNMMQSGSMLSMNNLSFTQPSPCFGTGATMSGQMMSGMQMGSMQNMQMTMTWTPSGSTTPNTLTMQGPMGSGMNSASGSFTITGMNAGCTSQTGTFTMTKMS